MRAPRALPAVLVLAMLTVAACAAVGRPAPPPAIGATSRDVAPANEGAPEAQKAFAPGPASIPLAVDPDRSIIVIANVSLRAPDPWAVSDRAQGIATGLGGDILSLSQSGSGDQRSANLTMRVPSVRFSDALRQLRALDAEVLASNVESKDVTDQFVDLQARLSGKQVEEQRYLALLARADKIDDILKINVSLSQVRTQIEQLQGQVNSIKSRTQYSTIVASISSSTLLNPQPLPGAWNPARTFSVALAALLSLTHAVADLAIWLLVIGGLPALILGLAFLARSRRRAPAAA